MAGNQILIGLLGLLLWIPLWPRSVNWGSLGFWIFLLTSKTGFTTTSRNQSILGPEVNEEAKKSLRNSKNSKKLKKIEKVQNSSKNLEEFKKVQKS